MRSHQGWKPSDTWLILMGGCCRTAQMPRRCLNSSFKFIFMYSFVHPYR